MRVNTPRFGQLDIPQEAIVTFPRGLCGFPELRECCLLPHSPGSPLRWLQCLNDTRLAFLTAEPDTFFPDYDIELTEAEAAALELRRSEDAAVLTLVTVSDGIESQESPHGPDISVTANLAAPIIINTRSRMARQVILDDERYTTKHSLGLPGLGGEGPATVAAGSDHASPDTKGR